MWRTAMTKAQKQKDQMNLAPAQLPQKHSRGKKTTPLMSLRFSCTGDAPLRNVIMELPWHSHGVKAYWAWNASILNWAMTCFICSTTKNYHWDSLPKVDLWKYYLPFHLNIWGKLWHPYATVALVFFFVCQVLVTSSCTYGIFQIPQLEKQLSFNAENKLLVAKDLVKSTI